MKTLRIGFVGYGAIGRVHAMGYRMIPHLYGLPADSLRITAVATSRPETAQAAAIELGNVFATDDFLALLARDDVDIVDVCVPNDGHLAVVEAAAAAGKAIYCEKPLALTVEEGKRMVAAVAAAGVPAQMTFNFRYFPAITRAQELVASGALGRIFSFHGRYFRSSYIDPTKPISWKQRPDICGGGALVDIGSHILDLLRFVMGEDYGEVQATLDTLITERPAAAGSTERVPVEVDDIALLTVRTEGGALGAVEVSRVATGASNDLGFEVYGERGALRWRQTDPGWLEFYDVGAPSAPHGGTRGFTRIEALGRYDGHKAPDASMAPDFVRAHAECQFQFLQAIREGRSPSPSLADGLHIQAVLQAAQRSALAGGWVSVAEQLAE